MKLDFEQRARANLFADEVAQDPCAAAEELIGLRDEVARLQSLINTPHTFDFMQAVQLEAVHQRERWGSEHDEGKTDADWFWLIGYLAGKALHKPENQLHHIITTAAACLNWHAARAGVVYIGVANRADFDKLALPVTDEGENANGHVLTKRIGNFDSKEVTVIFQHWVKQKSIAAMIEEAKKAQRTEKQ